MSIIFILNCLVGNSSHRSSTVLTGLSKGYIIGASTYLYVTDRFGFGRVSVLVLL